MVVTVNKSVVMGILIVGIVVVMVAAISIPLILEPDPEVPFETIHYGDACDNDTRGNHVITDLESWQELWDRFAAGGFWPSSLPPPEVNFETEVVIAVFQGGRPTTGYWTKITRIAFNGTCYEIYIDETHPVNCSVLTSHTAPHHIVKIPRVHQDVFQARFTYNFIKNNCEGTTG
ncbi:MAG: protease complex subunit PrcB family protein [Promethearchaeota archaeon]